MIPTRLFIRALSSALLGLACFASAPAFAKSGQFSFVTGIVTVESRGETRQAVAGMAINQSDVITTGPNGMAQLVMNDQARLSLRSNSRMVVQVYPETAMHQGAVVELTRGTLRAFTKLLTSNAQGYKMRTRVATVGIRGSDNLLTTTDDTTINYTIDGSHVVSSNQGSFAPIVTNPNQTVMVVLGQAPKIIPTPPSLLEAAKVMVGTGSGGGSGTGGDAGGGAPAQGNLTGGQGVVVGGNGLGYTLIDASSNLISDPVNLQNIVIATNGTAFSAEAIPSQITLDGGALRGYASYAGSQAATQLNISGGTPADLATITIGGATTVVIGRIVNPSGISFTGTGFSPGGSTHFGYGNAGFPAYLSEVLTGTVSYTRVGATTPTNQFGTLGNITSAVLDVNFTARTLNASVGITMPAGNGQTGGNWTLAAANVPFAFNSFVAFTGGGRLTVTNGSGQNSNNTSGLNGWIEGSFVGATLNGALFGYGLTDQSSASSTGYQSINGILVFAGPSQNAAAAYREGLVSDPRGVLSIANYIRSFATTNRPEEVTVGANGAVSAFAAPYVGNNQLVGHSQYQQGTATITDAGTDPTTGLVWGRWSGGTATIGGTASALGNASLHYVFGPVQSGPVSLPLTGTASYDVVGSTRPTDLQGNVGTLGSVTLNANFTNRTVDAGVTVNINNQTWNGTANGVPIYRDQYFFAAAGNRINGIPGPALFNITCAPNCTPQFRSGSLDGFFTGRTGQGAGMMYNMNGIAGAIAFARRGG